MEFLHLVSKGIVTVALAVASVFGYQPTPTLAPEVTPEIVREDAPILGQSLPQGTGVFETSLVSRIESTDTSMELTANAIRGGGTLSGYNCFTLDEGKAEAENVCGTISGTTVSSLTRGLSYANGTTTVSGNKFAHRRGANVKITDFPLLQIIRNLLNGEETFENKLAYTSHPTFTSGTQLIDKTYADNLANQGAATSSPDNAGISEESTKLETASSTPFDANNPHYISSENATSTYNAGAAGGNGLNVVITQNDNKIDSSFLRQSDVFSWSGNNTHSGTNLFTASTTHSATTTAAKTAKVIDFDVTVSATASTTFTGYSLPQPAYIATSTGKLLLSDANAYGAQNFDGFVVSSGVNGDTIYLQKDGIVPGFSGLTAGAKYYVQDAVGTIGVTAGTAEIEVGQAISDTEILITGAAISGSMQYLGSIAMTSSACVLYATSTYPMAKNIIVEGSYDSGGNPAWGIADTHFLTKYGPTSMTSAFEVTDTGPTHTRVIGVAAWNKTTDVISYTVTNGGGSASCTGTVYFYR